MFGSSPNKPYRNLSGQFFGEAFDCSQLTTHWQKMHCRAWAGLGWANQKN
jgi:hypothetical protein